MSPSGKWKNHFFSVSETTGLTSPADFFPLMYPSMYILDTSII